MKDVTVIIIDNEHLHATHYFRLIYPAMEMKRLGQKVVIFSSIYEMIEKISYTNVKTVIVSRFAIIHDIKGMSDFFKKHDIMLVVDLDDKWEIPYDRPHAKIYNNLHKKYIIDTIKAADVVWGASKHLCKQIKKNFSKTNVHWIPNGIDPNVKGWQPTNRSDKPLTFGYIGAMNRQADLSECKGVFEGKEFVTIYWGEKNTYGDILGGKTTHYKGLPINKYQYLYDHIDVAIAPLQNTEFNRCKSTLKAVEAGFKKVAFIGSDISLYREIITHNVNGFLCANRREWLSVVNSMTKEKAEDFGNKLYESIKDDYNITTTTQLRLNSIEIR
jgi:glycosyltransferase involved in cell wall biosynthesis